MSDDLGDSFKNKAIFLDRDGVINEAKVRSGKPYPPENLQQLVLTEDIEKVLCFFKTAGFLNIVVTNQPDVARGKSGIETVNEMNEFLLNSLPIDHIACCFHDDVDQCNCRKPNPGLLTTSSELFSVDLKESFMVGDRWRDVEAGKAAGCTTIFIDYGYNEENKSRPDYVVGSVRDACDLILGV